MEQLQVSLDRTVEYPANLIAPDTPALFLDSIRQELNNQAERIFCHRDAVSVDIIEQYQSERAYTFRCLRHEDDLRKQIQAPMVRPSHDPAWRMIFLYAPSSRDRLNVTVAIARLIFTYHQVSPAILESLFSFGFQEHASESSLTSFNSRNSITGPQRGLSIPQLARSGRNLELCYGLRSVERSSAQPDWPFSIRLCSIYHSLDVDSAQSFWIVIKANRLVERLVRDYADASGQSGGHNTSVGQSISRALHIHAMIAAWSGSNWQWYVSFLEIQLQDITRNTLTARMEPAEEVQIEIPRFTDEPPTMSPASTMMGDEKDFQKQGRLHKVRTAVRSLPSRLSTLRQNSRLQSGPEQLERMSVSRHQFSFQDLPRVHYLEEQASEALDTLVNNDDILENVRVEFASLRPCFQGSQEWSDVECALDEFDRKMSDVQKSLRQQRARLEKLLRLSGSRKALLDKILTYESIQANQLLAEQANKSAQNMELYAREQRRETVSMRVITLVTLFFLPGTFISTLMSTPIVTFDPGSPSTSDASISAGALGFYCAVSLPLVVLTFLSWWIVFWWENRKSKKQEQKVLTAGPEP